MSQPLAKLLNEALQHHQSGRLSDAERLYREILALDSRHADALHLLGVIAHQVGKNEIAADLIRKAIGIERSDPAYYSNLGVVLYNLSRQDEALGAYNAVLCLKPDYAEALSNRGNILRELGRLDDALADYDTALRLKPDHAEALCNRGIALREMNRLKEALDSYDAALRLRPNMAEAHSNRAAVLTLMGYSGEIAAPYEAALRLKPDFATAHSNLILDLHYGSDVADGAIETATRRFAELYPTPSTCFDNVPEPGRRLRIGYVSGDFCRHPVASFLSPVLAHHESDTFELFCYATRIHEDDMTAKLRAAADHWRSLAGVSDLAAAALIRRDGIDILIDLSGHTAFNRLTLFALKPAPVQVTWLGFPGSTGLAAIDYRLVDAISDPPDGPHAWTSETLIRLPNGFLCFDPPREAPDVAPPPCLNAPITFGSFNNPAKLSLATLDSWAALMNHLPESRLLLKGRPFDEKAARTLLLQRLKARGVAADRVDLLGWESGIGGHLGLYGRVDIALDPFPYNGTTTTCEALWMGVPVITIKGTRHSSRVGASLLSRLGLQELIAANADEYVRIAAALAADRERLSFLRRSLRERMAASPICDGPAFTRGFEHTLRTLWQNWCSEPRQT